MWAAVADIGRLEYVTMTFEECYQLHRHTIYRLCLRYGNGRVSWAEDATQDVFIRLFEKLPQLHHEEPIAAWLYTVATRVCISRIRRDKSLLNWITHFGERREVAPSSEVLFEEKESVALALATLAQLPPLERGAVSMKVLDGKSQREIAATLEVSEGYVSKLLTRAAARLDKAGWEASDVAA
jgi:RNA polymerase sigma factor (sigma-70 family)